MLFYLMTGIEIHFHMETLNPLKLVSVRELVACGHFVLPISVTASGVNWFQYESVQFICCEYAGMRLNMCYLMFENVLIM